MFEGQIVPAAVEDAPDSTPEGGALRAPAWPELVARIAAAHDLRHAMARAGAHPAGNFACFGERGGRSSSASGSPSGPITWAGRIFWFSIIASLGSPLPRNPRRKAPCPQPLCHALNHQG